MGNKLNLVFDFNNIAMRALFTCVYAGDGEISTFDTDREISSLICKLTTDMAYVVRLFNPDKVIVACDTQDPWRKQIYKQIEGEEYKGTRVKDNTKNWNKIWEGLNDFKKILKQKNFIVTEIPEAEADDLAALWKNESFKNGESVVLVSSDRDWVQLVDFDESNKLFCVCLNPIANNKKHKSLFVTESFNQWLTNPGVNKVDIFFNNYNSLKDTFKNIQSKDSKIYYETIVPSDVALEKIMCGDDGDNVPSIYHFYKNGKKTRVTPLKSKKILEELNVFTIKDLCESCNAGALQPAIEKIMKKELDDVDIDERLMRQRKLVELNPILFPENIKNIFSHHIDDIKDCGYISVDSAKTEIILKGTKYLDKNYGKPKENSIFDNLKDLEKFIKPVNVGLF